MATKRQKFHRIYYSFFYQMTDVEFTVPVKYQLIQIMCQKLIRYWEHSSINIHVLFEFSFRGYQS